MGLVNHIHLLESIHHHVVHKSTGTPRQFAKKLNISVRTLYRILEELKDLGALIEFDTIIRSYVYKKDVEIHLIFKISNPKK